jgi:2-keto-4-pentenoate hydratase/2-oxohepta-3-ene-1,7-dioic acid hydratase in catechol pathway
LRYCRLRNGEAIVWAEVEERDGQWWAVRLHEPMPEDAGARRSWAAGEAGHAFQPVSLQTLQAQGLLLPPVVPSKIVCVGRNYRDHAKELGNDISAEPLLFLKPPSSLLSPGGTVERPAASSRVDFEGELAIVIGTRATKLQENEDVRRYIRGYCCLNDVTARDLQKSDAQWTRGKGFDTFCPAGPLLSDEIDPTKDNLRLLTRLNGEVRQQGKTHDFLFDIPTLLRYISHVMTLEPGDVIATGTPAGVGPMQAGDQVEVEIEGLGVLQNSIA